MRIEYEYGRNYTTDSMPSEIEKALRSIAHELRSLGNGNAASSTGAIENLAAKNVKAAELIANAISGAGCDVKDGLDAIANALRQIAGRESEDE